MLKKGSIYLTELPFTDQKKSKIRPVVVLHHDVVYDDVIVMAISSVTSRRSGQNTIPISVSDNTFYETGLKKESVILTNRIVTLNRRRLFHRLGLFSNQYLDEIGRNIVSIFQIGITQATNQTNQTDKNKFIPYGRQSIDDDDVYSVVKTLRSEFLTTGPNVEEFESGLCELTGAKHAIACSNGTAALHLACLALGIGENSLCVTSPITFLSSANCVEFCNGRVDFIDIDPNTLCLSSDRLEEYCQDVAVPDLVIPVDFAGVPADLPAKKALADKYGFKIIEDAAHSIGSTYTHNGTTYHCGGCAHSDMAIFSFHPVKTVTTGEGGAVLTNDDEMAEKIRQMRSHGIMRDSDLSGRNDGPWYYEMADLNFNSRITDFQCALGKSQ